MRSTFHQKVRDEWAEQRLTDRRFRVLVILMMAVLLLLGLRFGTLQLGDHEQYAARADENRIRLRALPPNRGLILDRRGRVLADNRPAYRLVIVPERTPGLEETLGRLGGGAGIHQC